MPFRMICRQLSGGKEERGMTAAGCSEWFDDDTRQTYRAAPSIEKKTKHENVFQGVEKTKKKLKTHG